MPKNTAHQSPIEIGEEIYVDKGVCGLDSGKLLSIDGFSIGGYFGTYFSTESGEERVFDQTVHKITRKTND